MILLVCSHPEFSPGSGQVRNLSLSVLQTIWMPRQRCKTSDTCSECAWLLQGSVWRRKFPWLWAGYAGKTTTLTVGCTDCALHAAKFNAAASRFPLMPPSVQPDRNWKTWKFRYRNGSNTKSSLGKLLLRQFQGCFGHEKMLERVN